MDPLLPASEDSSSENTFDIDHATAHQAVLDTINLMAAHAQASEDEIVALLQQQGYSRIAAEKLNAMVPSGLSWVVLKRLGVASLPNHFILYDDDEQEVKVPVATQHFFTAALHLSYSTFEHGWSEVLPRDVFESVVNRSAEMSIVFDVLNAGESLEGTTLSPVQLLRISAQEMLESGPMRES
jgi:hypothetical protein